MLQIYDSLTRSKRTFVPRREGQVGIYVCGMTVYDYCHMGHARVLVVFDMVVRYLRHLGFDVTFVRNITDVDDKIIARAAERGEPIDDLTRRFIDAMNEDCAALFVETPDREPRATEHIEQIINMVRQLLKRDYAYIGPNGDVYFSVRKFNEYGKLSGESVDALRVGARIETDDAKSDPLDFVLWKRAKPGEPFWESPWGKGRPGWHIECSAMSTHCLGNHFDIHAGGIDLRFPHHENEIAQSVAATGEPFANFWMHNGYVQIDKQKMSKSLENFFTIREVLDRDPNRQRMGEALRFMILSSHYRSPVNFSNEAIENAKAGLARLYLALRGVELAVKNSGKAFTRGRSDAMEPSLGNGTTDGKGDYNRRFMVAMNDDFNSPEAIAVMFDLAREINRRALNSDVGHLTRLANNLRGLGAVLGVLNCQPSEFLGTAEASTADDYVVEGMTNAAVQALVQRRNDARQGKEWRVADQIRRELEAKGIVLEDKPDGSTEWRIKQ